jgi:hypothetical protein
VISTNYGLSSSKTSATIGPNPEWNETLSLKFHQHLNSSNSSGNNTDISNDSDVNNTTIATTTVNLNNSNSSNYNNSNCNNNNNVFIKFSVYSENFLSPDELLVCSF